MDEINDKHIKQLQDLNIILHFEKKKYDFGATVCGSSVNWYYFTEYINIIQKLTNDYEKVLIMYENNFFTKGEIIHFLLNNEFYLAYGAWIEPDGIKD